MLEREPTSTLEELKIDVHGTTHCGQRVVLVVSDTEVRQEIRFRGLRRVDPDVYAAADRDFMRSVAQRDPLAPGRAVEGRIAPAADATEPARGPHLTAAPRSRGSASSRGEGKR